MTRAITSIGDDAWTPIHYPNAIFDDDEQRLVSDAEVAETSFTAFTSRRHHEHVTARLIVRRVRRLNPATTAGKSEMFTVYRYHAVFTPTMLTPRQPVDTQRDQHRDAGVAAAVSDTAFAPATGLAQRLLRASRRASR